jgi:hypothetical protein
MMALTELRRSQSHRCICAVLDVLIIMKATESAFQTFGGAKFIRHIFGIVSDELWILTGPLLPKQCRHSWKNGCPDSS